MKSPSDCTDDATNMSHHDDDKESIADDNKSTEIILATGYLIKAIAIGDIKHVASLLDIVDSNKKLNVWGLGQVTPAGECNYLRCCSCVTLNGVNFLIGLCCCHGQYGVLKLVLDTDRGEHCDGEGFMLLAAAGNNVPDDSLINCAKLLLNLDNENVNQTNTQGWTRLTLSARRGRKSLVEFLLEHGAQDAAQQGSQPRPHQQEWPDQCGYSCSLQ